VLKIAFIYTVVHNDTALGPPLCIRAQQPPNAMRRIEYETAF